MLWKRNNKVHCASKLKCTMDYIVHMSSAYFLFCHFGHQDLIL